MIFSVVKWCPEHDYHQCMDTFGNKHRFDLLISNSVDLKPEEFVGKTFEANDNRITPYVSIVNHFWEKTEIRGME